MAGITPFEIVKRTPKSNCGECGFPTCLAFGAAVATRGEDPRRCPHIDPAGLPPDRPATGADSRARDQQLAQTLRKKIAHLDFTALAGALGAQFPPRQTGILAFRYLGKEVLLLQNAVLMIDGQAPEEPRDQILLYNYLFFGGGSTPSDAWVGMESLPNSISKTKTLKTYCEDRLAGLFAGTDSARITAICRRMDGAMHEQAGADLAMVIPVLPMIPLKIVYWRESPEDGFGAAVKVLFDRHVLAALDLESLVFCAERLAERFSEELDPA